MDADEAVNGERNDDVEKPLQIIETVEFEHVFNLDEAALESVLLDPSVADKVRRFES